MPGISPEDREKLAALRDRLLTQEAVVQDQDLNQDTEVQTPAAPKPTVLRAKIIKGFRDASEILDAPTSGDYAWEGVRTPHRDSLRQARRWGGRFYRTEVSGAHSNLDKRR